MRRFLACALATLLATVAPAVFATAQRTFVASSGSDFNACSLIAPCRSFGAAIAQTNPGGEIVVLDSAGYGKVTITQSISIIAPPGIYGGISVLAAGDIGVTINAPGGTVVLRGLSINGQGGLTGVEVQAADRVRIESCVISAMTGNGVSHHADGAELIVLDTVVRDNGGTGIGMAANAVVVLDHVRSEHNVYDGFYVKPSVGGVARGTAVDSVFARNGNHGVWADSAHASKTYLRIERSTIDGSGADGVHAESNALGSTVYAALRRNAISGNGNDGILLVSAAVVAPLSAQLADNSVTGNASYGIAATGPAYQVHATSNDSAGNGGFDLYCDTSGASFFNVYKSNVVAVSAGTCTTATPL